MAIVVSLGVVVFTFASGGLSSLTGSFTGLISGQGNAVAERLAVEQATFSTAPTVDGSATGSFSTAASGALTLTTNNPNDIIVVFVANEDLAGAIRTVSSVTATGLTFVEKGSSVSTSASPFSEAEVWYAAASSVQTSTVITVTLSGSTDDASIVAIGVTGANTGSPWDSNAGLPAHASSNSGATAPSVGSVSTSNSADLVLGFTGAFDATTHAPPAQTPGSGFSLVATQNNGGGTGKSQALVEQEAVTSTLSSSSVAFGTSVGATNAWIMIANAIQGNPGASVFVRNVGTISSTIVSVYVVDQSTNSFIGQFSVTAPVGVGNYVEVSQSTIGFAPSHGHSYSFTVTSSLGNSVEFFAKET